MSGAEQLVAPVRRKRRPRASSCPTECGRGYRPRVGREWIGETAYSSAEKALSVARCDRDMKHPRAAGMSDRPTPTAESLTEPDREALRKLAELRLPVEANFVLEISDRYAALRDRGLVEQPTPGKWSITNAGRIALR